MRRPAIDCKKVKGKIIRRVKAEFKKRGFKKAVFGLSGGVDSSLVAFLLEEALGAGSVTAYFLPYKTTDRQDKRHFGDVAKTLGIRSAIIPIAPMVDCYFKKFPAAGRLRRGNKMARERMSILYDQSSAGGALVVGSGNKTEILLGYATLFGDTACAVNPIGSLYKTQVRQLAAYVGVPPEIIAKPPTAGLWPGQTDEGELGLSYEAIDEMLYFLVDRKYSRTQTLKKGFPKQAVDKILKRIRNFKYKRELPAIVKL